MADDPKSKRRSPFGPVFAVVVLLVLYPLSYGPAWWLIMNGYISASVFSAVYTPIYWLAENWEWFGDLLRWYIALWVPFLPLPVNHLRLLESMKMALLNWT